MAGFLEFMRSGDPGYRSEFPSWSIPYGIGGRSTDSGAGTTSVCGQTSSVVVTNWCSKELGDGVEAFVPTTEIQNAFVGLAQSQARLGQYSFDAAVFSRCDLETNVVAVYFTPSAELLARAVRASPCESVRVRAQSLFRRKASC